MRLCIKGITTQECMGVQGKGSYEKHVQGRVPRFLSPVQAGWERGSLSWGTVGNRKLEMKMRHLAGKVQSINHPLQTHTHTHTHTYTHAYTHTPPTNSRVFSNTTVQNTHFLGPFMDFLLSFLDMNDSFFFLLPLETIYYFIYLWCCIYNMQKHKENYPRCFVTEWLFLCL